MKDFLIYLVKSIVTKPEEVEVNEEVKELSVQDVEEGQAGGKHLSLVLSVADDDMGLVIGKQGKTISALRRMLRLRNINTQEFQSVSLELEDSGSDVE